MVQPHVCDSDPESCATCLHDSIFHGRVALSSSPAFSATLDGPVAKQSGCIRAAEIFRPLGFEPTSSPAPSLAKIVLAYLAGDMQNEARSSHDYAVAAEKTFMQ